ncbi:MAG: hypothetical protein H7841_09195 [Magnetospirillum sp. WYHS-4]
MRSIGGKQGIPLRRRDRSLGDERIDQPVCKPNQNVGGSSEGDEQNSGENSTEISKFLGESKKARKPYQSFRRHITKVDIEKNAHDLAELFHGHGDKAADRVLREIAGNGVLAILVYDSAHPRRTSNDPNELVYGLMKGKTTHEVDSVEKRATELAAMWLSHDSDTKAHALADILKDGLLAIWTFEQLPPPDATNDRATLKKALVAVFSLIRGGMTR